jgi:ADP-L-glycero-D-manno-heptose 6-epimerase
MPEWNAARNHAINNEVTNLIIVTGGAGFIGSNIVKALNERGEDEILVVDRLGNSEKWRNLSDLSFIDYEHKDDFILRVERGLFDRGVSAVFHMGACSSTTELDADYLMSNNFEYTKRLATRFGGRHGLRFVYASSAATYGDGSRGYSDDHVGIGDLRPLNMYGYSKQCFDLWALKTGFLEAAVGLKYFNVFGPNEYHKADMRSVAIRAYSQIKKTGVIRLFKSYRPEYRDGEQCRDFIYVKDAVSATLHFLENPDLSGIYNVGTGRPRTFLDLALALGPALDRPPSIEYIDMPEGLEKRYQYHTAADTAKLRASGFTRPFMSLEDSVRDYVVSYLERDPRGFEDL